VQGEIFVRFSPQELDDLDWAARKATMRSAHIPNPTRRDLSKTQAEADWIGLASEWSVASMFGLSIRNCGTYLKGMEMDGGRDLALPCGRSVQVKGIQLRTNTNHPMWFALENTTPRLGADFGVLVLIRKDRESARIVGYTTRLHFIARGRVLDLGTGARFGIRADRMLPMNEWPPLKWRRKYA